MDSIYGYRSIKEARKEAEDASDIIAIHGEFPNIMCWTVDFVYFVVSNARGDWITAVPRNPTDNIVSVDAGC